MWEDMKSSVTVEQGKKNFAKQLEGLLNVPADEFTVKSYVDSMHFAKKEGLSGIMGMMPWTKNSPELKALDAGMSNHSFFVDAILPFVYVCPPQLTA
jgi:hypothetical protein